MVIRELTAAQCRIESNGTERGLEEWVRVLPMVIEKVNISCWICTSMMGSGNGVTG